MRTALLALCMLALLASAAAFDTFEHGTAEEEELSAELEMVELDAALADAASVGSMQAAKPAFPATSFYSTLTPHLTYNDAVNHCESTGAGVKLCKTSAVCPEGDTPRGGVRTARALLPVRGEHGRNNTWISLSAERTCEEQRGKQWGSTAVYRAFKGLVACCDVKGEILEAKLSQWEGFLVKSPELNAIFMVEQGMRRSIPSAKSFQAQGFHFQRVKLLTAAALAAIPLGQPLEDHSAKLANSEPFIHALLGYAHDGGSPFEAYEGYLVKKQGSPITCMIAHGSKRCIPDADTFEAAGFEYKLVQLISSDLYDAFPAGEAFPSRAGAAPNSELYSHPLLGANHHGRSNLLHTAVSADSFVSSAFRRILDREATEAERKVYAAQLSSKRHVPTLVRKLASTPAFESKHLFPLLVQALYKRLLERAPTDAEAADLQEYFVRARASNDPTKTVKTVVSRFVLAKEHQDRFVASTTKPISVTEALTNLYRHVLNRQPSEEELKEQIESQTANGWKHVITHLLESNEYREVNGLYGVPGAKRLYGPAVAAVYKKLLNVEPTSLTKPVLGVESLEIATHGWAAWIEDFLRRKEYIVENGKTGFLDETDRTITLA